MICEFCNGVHDVDIEEHVAVDLYVYDNEVVACCFNCLSNLDADKRQTIHLPDGWEVIKKDKRWEMEKAEKAFIEVREEMIKQPTPGGMGYFYGLREVFKRIVNMFEKRIDNYKQYEKSIGIYNHHNIYSSRAYCPECKSPLLKMVSLPVKKAIQTAASDVVKVMEGTREARNKKAFVCLNCQVSYTSNIKE